MVLTDRRKLVLAAAAIALVAGTAGYLIAGYRSAPTEDGNARRVLYWYDPMVPSQHFDKPGKSPFMDMQLVPRYADEGEAVAGVRIDPARTQNLGLRTATARMGTLDMGFTATGTIDFNERDVTIVQARAGGFIKPQHILDQMVQIDLFHMRCRGSRIFAECINHGFHGADLADDGIGGTSQHLGISLLQLGRQLMLQPFGR